MSKDCRHARRALCSVFVLLGAAACGAPQAAMPSADACAALARAEPGSEARVTAAEWVRADATRPWRSPDGFRQPAFVKVPFCRVAAQIPSSGGLPIRFELWLPSKSNWNGRFFGTASGGSMGAIQYAALAMPLERGFAAMAHDNGHRSENVYEQNWAFDPVAEEPRRERLVDFASRAQHLATVVGKALVATFYGEPARHAYFVGCSQGGHHGMMEAARHPDDYDGIVAGAHGGEWTGMVASEAWAAWQVSRDDRAGALSPELAAAVSRRAVARCDADDGLTDGLIADPRACDFDPALMQCGTETADAGECLTPAQVAVTRAIYAGPRTAAGRRLAPGFAPGSEQYWPWNDELSFVSGSYYDFFRLLVHADPDWDFLSFDWDRDVDAGRERLGPIYDAQAADLSRFHGRGGRLIMYHGWSDPLISPFLSIGAWEEINSQLGARRTAEFARLFMIPGMAHCGGGAVGGTRYTHDAAWLTAIRNWVEDGIAPDGDTPRGTVTGVGTVDGRLRTRPYCPYPAEARYLGTGSIDHAGNFVCETP